MESSRGNKIISEIVQGVLEVDYADQYQEYPNFEIDVEKEQQRLTKNDLIVFQFPWYWYSTPALMKKWQDDVLTYGFAYPPKEGTALHGKSWLCVITTGGPQESYQSGGYNNFTLSELLRPLQQTAILCGMKWLPPQVINGVLPGDYEGIRAASDEDLKLFSTNICNTIKSGELQKEHSLKPINSPYSTK